MIDIHCHIIPYVDDGAKNIGDAISMGKIACEDGITDIIATPHYIAGTSTIAAKARVEEETRRLNELFCENEIKLNIYPGCEVFITPDLPQLLEKGEISSLNNSRYVLVELPMSTIPLFTEEILYELELMQYVPILAHPERNLELNSNIDIVRKYVEKGMLLQVNAGSLMGEFGKQVERAAWELVKSGLVQFVATDAHRLSSRSPKLKSVRDELVKRVGKYNADLLMVGNPMRVLGNEEVEVMESVRCKKGLFGWFGKRL